MANRWWVGGAGTWDGIDTTHWSTSNGGPGGASAPTTSDFAIFDSLAGSGVVTTTAGAVCSELGYGPTSLTSLNLGANLTTSVQGFSFFGGTVNLGSFTLTCGVAYGVNGFNSNTTSARTLNFGTGNITILASNASSCAVDGTNLTVTGSRTINYSNAALGTTGQIYLFNFTDANALDVNVNGNAATVLYETTGSVYRNLNYTGFTGSLGSTGARTIYGNLTTGTTATLGGTSILSFAATSGTQTVTGGRPISFPVAQTGVGGTVQLASNTTFSSYNLTNGTLNLANNTLTINSFFNSANSNTRVVQFGTGNITCTTGASSFNVTGTGLTYTGTPNVNITNAGGNNVVRISTTGAYTIPADFGSLSYVDCIGAGGRSTTASGGGGGGGGAWNRSTAVTGLTAGGTAYTSVFAGGFNSVGTDTWFNAASNAAPTLTSQGALAKAGSGNAGLTGGNGGFGSSGVGTSSFNGGTGGNCSSSGTAGAGGGGAAGPNGAGGSGATRNNAAPWGGGGGGANGAANVAVNIQTGSAGVSGGGSGGNGYSGSGPPPQGDTGGSGTTYALTAGGTVGPGGGGGGGGTSPCTGGGGGSFGGGSGGTRSSSTTTSAGLIIFSYNVAFTLTTNTGFTETNAFNFSISGTFPLTETAGNVYRNLNYTGFLGATANVAKTIYGDLTTTTSGTISAGANAWTFGATSGTQTITPGGRTYDFPLNLGAGSGTATYAFSGALTVGSTRTTTFYNGTLQFTAGTTNNIGASFVTTGGTIKYLTSSVSGTQATISKASGTTTVTYLSVKDSIAQVGTWDGTSTTNVNAGNNSGWLLPPVLSPSNFFLMFR